jgi:hypothetical protein
MDDPRPDPFGALRSLMQGQPSLEAWREVWGLLSALEGHEADRAFAYVARPLDRWPDALRVFGRSLTWGRASDPRLYTVCRTLDLSNSRETLSWLTRDADANGLEYPHDFSRITRLDLSSSLEPFGAIAKYMTHTRMTSVRHVDLSKSKRSSSETEADLDAFCDALVAQAGAVSLDLTHTRWVRALQLRRLLERAGDTIDALGLSRARQDGATLGALAHARGGALRTLDLSRNRAWNNHGLDVLLESKVLGQLHALDLSRNDLNGRQLGPLVAAIAPTIRRLGLTEVREPTFLRDRLGGHALPRLTQLALDTEGFSSRVDPEGARELTLAGSGCGGCDLPAHPIFGRLTHLTLWRSADADFVADLLGRADLSALRALTLEDTRAPGRALEALVGNPTAAGVARLHLLNPDLGGDAGEGLARLLELESLSELRITRLGSGDAQALEALAASPRLARLGELALLDCAMTDEVVVRLFLNPALARLELLRMRPTGGLGEDAAILLVDPPYTPRHWRPTARVMARRLARKRAERLQ